LIPTFQSYPPPTELPAMREGELDGRYMDCTLALAPVSDTFAGVGAVSIAVTRQDGIAMGPTDLASAGGAWLPTLDATGCIFTTGWIATVGSAGVTYILTLTASTTQGRTFIRDWSMSVVPLLG
jgi:hypothetical protein